MGRWILSGVAAGLMAIAYVGLALGNEWAMSATEYGKGVNWVYAPAGLRLCFVLVLPVEGALGITLGSFYMAAGDPELTPALAAINGCVTGIAPYLARRVAIARMDLRDDLHQLNPTVLIKLCLLFGLFSSTFHQAFFVWLGREAGLFSGAIPMFVGDTLGALLCLFLFKAALDTWARHRH